MFNVGDLVVYSSLGICTIVDICKKSFNDVAKNYYVLHPRGNSELQIYCPVESEKSMILKIIDEDEALNLLESFKKPGVEWIEKHNNRNFVYTEIVQLGDRKEISKVINTLLRKELEAAENKKKLGEYDRKLLNSTQNIMFSEMAISLKTTPDAIFEKVINLIGQHEYPKVDAL